jgi:hypothetical protein
MFLFNTNYDRLGASRAEIAAEAAKTATAYSIAASQVEELSSLAHVGSSFTSLVTSNVLQRLKDTLSNRKKRWEIFRSHISSRAKAQFTYLLSERSFRGRLLTDHVNKLLDLQASSSSSIQLIFLIYSYLIVDLG